MSQLMLDELARDEAAHNSTVRVGWLWPDVVALVLVSAGVGFCVGVLV